MSPTWARKFDEIEVVSGVLQYEPQVKDKAKQNKFFDSPRWICQYILLRNRLAPFVREPRHISLSLMHDILRLRISLFIFDRKYPLRKINEHRGVA
jgi:hypothetical protein